MAPRPEDLADEDAPIHINPYEVLDIEKDATADQVKSAYRKSALREHPGK
jgi:DnaJ family protein C protein 9